MAVNYLNLNRNNEADKESLDVINTLAELEDRKPHDTLRRLILESGNKKIKELSAPSDNPQSVSELSEDSTSDNEYQEQIAQSSQINSEVA